MYLGRKEVLEKTYYMFKQTGLFLIYMQGSGGYSLSPYCDDLGLFIYSSLIAHFFKIDPVDAAYFLINVLYGITFVGLFIGICLLTKKWVGRVISLFLLFWLLRAILINVIQDVYVAYCFAFIPLPFLLFVLAKQKNKLSYGFSFAAGFIFAFANTIRVFSGLPVMCFTLIVCLFSKAFSKKNKIIMLGCFALGYIIPSGYVYYQAQKSLNFCGENNRFKETSHTIWHNMYIGFGFLTNDKGIIYDDAYGLGMAQAVDENVVGGSKECHNIMRDLVFKLIKQSPYFVITTIFAKIGVILFLFLWMFGWLALFCSYFYPKPWFIEIAFLIALGISALPGIMTIPFINFLLGFYTCTILYAICSLIYALDAGMLDDIKLFIQKCLKRISKY